MAVESSRAGRPVARWALKTSEETVAAAPEPVPFTANRTEGVYGALLGAGRMPILPLPMVSGSAAPVLSAQGHFVDVVTASPHGELTMVMAERSTPATIVRLDVLSGELTRLPYAPRPDGRSVSGLAATDSGSRLVMSQHLPRPGQSYPDTVLTVVDVEAGTSRELAVLAGSSGDDPEDPGLLWSPDGRRVCVKQASLAGGMARVFTVILDVSTGDVVRVLEGETTVGSLAWSPDSARLIVSNFDRLRIVDVATGEHHRIPGLPEVRPLAPGAGAHRVLGFLDDEHLLTATDRRGTLMIWRTHLETGPLEPLVRVTGTAGLYPRLARMPVGYWTDPA